MLEGHASKSMVLVLERDGQYRCCNTWNDEELEYLRKF